MEDAERRGCLSNGCNDPWLALVYEEAAMPLVSEPPLERMRDCRHGTKNNLVAFFAHADKFKECIALASEGETRRDMSGECYEIIDISLSRCGARS